MRLGTLMLLICCCGGITLSNTLLAQEDALSSEPLMGPVVPDYGPVLMPPAGFYSLDPSTHYKVSIDIGSTADFPGDRNLKLTSVARFLNMYAQQGIPRENIEFAVIVHGMAANDLLSDEAYRARNNDPNPNTELLNQLHNAGVKIYLCGQTAAFRNIGWDEIRPEVVVALSAMGAHVRLQQEGYTLIPF